MLNFTEGSYDGCDTTVVSNVTKMFALDPAESIEDSNPPMLGFES